MNTKSLNFEHDPSMRAMCQCIINVLGMLPACYITSKICKRRQSGKQIKTLTCHAGQVMFLAECNSFLSNRVAGQVEVQGGKQTLGAACPALPKRCLMVHCVRDPRADQHHLAHGSQEHIFTIPVVCALPYYCTYKPDSNQRSDANCVTSRSTGCT